VTPSPANQATAARVGLVTCAGLPEGDPDDAFLTAALERAGVQHEWIAWSTHDSSALQRTIDVLVLRSPWDYTDNYPAFVTWLNQASVPVINPLDVVLWNTNKSYLLELSQRGIPVVPTQIIESAAHSWQPPRDFDEFVVKPLIGAGSKGARRFLATDIDEARDHARSLIDHGSAVMVQPYLPSVDEGSETAVIFIEGRFSHSVTKGPMLTRDGGRPMVGDLYVEEDIAPRAVTAEQLQVAQATIAAIPGPTPMYARVDLIDDLDGAPIVLELELVEPSLFFTFQPAAADTFVAALTTRI
jgi:glutathione synthase/RimK-type ligase-like ATP-grasp enzyme